MKNIDHVCQAFFRLIAEHGRFQLVQLHEYARLRLGRELTIGDLQEIRMQIDKGGGKQDKLDTRLWQMPCTKRKPFPKGHKDTLSGELFPADAAIAKAAGKGRKSV